MNPDRQGNRPIWEVEIPPKGRVVHRKGFGLVRVFQTVSHVTWLIPAMSSSQLRNS
jgi:hypothetical protein